MSEATSGLRVPGVVVAAGLSERMGQFKPLLPLGGASVIGRVVDALQRSGVVWPIVVVTGYRADELREHLRDAGVSLVHNGAYRDGGMLSSVQVGFAALGGDAPAAVLALGDQPLVKPDTIGLLVRAWDRHRPPLVQPRHNGKRGHPIVVSRELIQEALALTVGQTLREVTARHFGAAIAIDVDDAGVCGDLDTPEDYERLRRIADGCSDSPQ